MKVRSGFYGYGLVHQDGKPYFDDACVCEDAEPLHDIASDYNECCDRPEHKLTVVRLMWKVAQKETKR